MVASCGGSNSAETLLVSHGVLGLGLILRRALLLAAGLLHPVRIGKRHRVVSGRSPLFLEEGECAD